LHEHPVITGKVKATALVIAVEPVCTAAGKIPMLHLLEVGQPGDQPHRGLTDREKHARERGIRYTPSWSAGKVDCVFLAAVEGHRMKLGPLACIADAGGNREARRRRNRDPIRFGTGLEYGTRFKAD